MSDAQQGNGFSVDPWGHALGGFVDRHRRLWIRLGNLETRLLADTLDGWEVEQPVYVAGLARSGSTLLLEVLDWLPEVATHRYRDYPMLYTPYLWNRFLEHTPRSRAEPVERTHRDGILVTSDSPEAFEEMLWMAFFPRLHDPASSSVLDGETDSPAFEAFYRDHIRKLLRVREGSRYVSKGNYNVTRLEYLQRIFPDARFVIPVRDPVWHIASLMKQHRLFCRGQEGNPRAVTHLQRVGHFEFGMDRRPINAGDTDTVREIMSLWSRGAEVEGWARYWNHIHAYLADRLERSRELSRGTLIVRYEELCRDPSSVVTEMLTHCGLPVTDEMVERARRRIRFPTYYQPSFTEQEIDVIRGHTDATASRLGLDRARPPASASFG